MGEELGIKTQGEVGLMLVDVGRKRGLMEQDPHPVLLLRNHLFYQLCRVGGPCSSRVLDAAKLPLEDQMHQLGGSPGWDVTLSLLLLSLLNRKALPFPAAASRGVNRPHL